MARTTLRAMGATIKPLVIITVICINIYILWVSAVISTSIMTGIIIIIHRRKCGIIVSTDTALAVIAFVATVRIDIFTASTGHIRGHVEIIIEIMIVLSVVMIIFVIVRIVWITGVMMSVGDIVVMRMMITRVAHVIVVDTGVENKIGSLLTQLNTDGFGGFVQQRVFTNQAAPRCAPRLLPSHVHPYPCQRRSGILGQLTDLLGGFFRDAPTATLRMSRGRNPTLTVVVSFRVTGERFCVFDDGVSVQVPMRTDH